MDKLFLVPDLRKIVKVKTLTTDNFVFRLHYRLTALVLVAASLMVSASQFFGNPIKCMVLEGVPAAVVESFCWVESTFSLPASLDKEVGHEVPYPGVGKHVKGEERIEHAYYQWVCIVLFLQACLFLVPHVLWRSWEKHKISNLLQGLNKPAIEYEVRHGAYKTLVDYFVDRGRGHQEFFFKHFLCEILNFVNVVGQIFLVDKFLHGEFSTYGSKVFQFMMTDQDSRYDPMIRVFPRMTKCTFHHYGPSGDVQKLDTYCVLSLNILNEKIYVFVWFWLVILALLSGLALVYRLVMVLSSRLRFLVVRRLNTVTGREKLGTVFHYLSYGDWFVLYRLGINMDKLHFMELIDELAATLETLNREDASDRGESPDGLKKTWEPSSEKS